MYDRERFRHCVEKALTPENFLEFIALSEERSRQRLGLNPVYEAPRFEHLRREIRDYVDAHPMEVLSDAQLQSLVDSATSELRSRKLSEVVDEPLPASLTDAMAVARANWEGR